MTAAQLEAQVNSFKRRLKCLSCEDSVIKSQIEDLIVRIEVLEQGGGSGGDFQEQIDDLDNRVTILENILSSKADLIGGIVPLSQLPVSTFTTYVNYYSDLPSPNTATGEKYGVLNSQGTAWLPGTIGGTYYSKGYYYSNGTTWIYMGSFPFQATQSSVDAGIITDQFISPATFENASKWNTKEDAFVKNTAFNKNFGLSSNTVLEGNRISQSITLGITDKIPSEDAVFNSLSTKEPLISLGSIFQYWRGDKTWQTLDKSAVGLANVDNTSDLNKPISITTQTALDNKQKIITSGTAAPTGGVDGDIYLQYT